MDNVIINVNKNTKKVCMFNHTGLPGLLDKLEKNGWSYTDRAVVIYEWRSYVLNTWVNPNSIQHKEMMLQLKISEIIRGELLKIDTMDDYNLYKKRKSDLILSCLNKDNVEDQSIFQHNEGIYTKNNQFEYSMEMMKILSSDLSVEILDMKGQTTKDMVRAVSGVDEFKLTDDVVYIRENIKTKEDYDGFVSRNSQQNYIRNKEKIPLDIMEVYNRLESACIRAEIASLTLNSFDVDDIEACWNFVGIIEDVDKRWREILQNDDISVGMGMLNLYLASPYVQSSGVYIGSIGLNDCFFNTIHLKNITGYDEREVLAHEAWHMHDFNYPVDDVLDKEKHDKNLMRSAVELQNMSACIKLMDDIKSEADILDINSIKQSESGISQRWGMFMPEQGNELEKIKERWLEDRDDVAFLNGVLKLFDNSAFYESKEFRAILLLSELHTLNDFKNNTDYSHSNLILDMGNTFDKNKEENECLIKHKTDIYAENYLNIDSEISARAWQSLFASDDKKMVPLMVGFKNKKKLEKIYREFFSDPQILEIYKKKRRQLEEFIDKERKIQDKSYEIVPCIDVSVIKNKRAIKKIESKNMKGESAKENYKHKQSKKKQQHVKSSHK